MTSGVDGLLSKPGPGMLRLRDPLAVVCASALFACGISAVGIGPVTNEDGSTTGTGSGDGSTRNGDGATGATGSGSNDADVDATDASDASDAAVDSLPADPYTTRVTSGLVA